MGFDNVPSAHHVSGGELLALFLQVPPEVHGVHLDQISGPLDGPVFGLSDSMRACLQQAGGSSAVCASSHSSAGAQREHPVLERG